MLALDPYVTKIEHPNFGTRFSVNRAAPGGRVTWALVGPLFGIALLIAAEDLRWIDEGVVRELIDRATGPELDATTTSCLLLDPHGDASEDAPVRSHTTDQPYSITPPAGVLAGRRLKAARLLAGGVSLRDTGHATG